MNERTSETSWREAILIPTGFGERESAPRQMKWPKDMAKRVQSIADEHQQEFTSTTLHLLKWALDEYDRQRAEEKKKEKRGA